MIPELYKPLLPLTDYDAIELHPCWKAGDVIERCSPDEADMWSVYLHLREGGVECIGDLDSLSEAKAFALGVATVTGFNVQ